MGAGASEAEVSTGSAAQYGGGDDWDLIPVLSAAPFDQRVPPPSNWRAILPDVCVCVLFLFCSFLGEGRG